MQGRNHFTNNEINTLRTIISQLHTLPKDKQKGQRNKMRKMGFYISDFTSTITPEIFDSLIKNGSIIISDIPNPSIQQSTSPHVNKESCISTLKKKVKRIFTGTNQEKLSCFEPIVDEESQILILGSMPGVESLTKQEYYAKNGNAMWRIIADIFNKGIGFSTYEEKVKCLHNNHIAMWDTMKTCKREGSLDSAITDIEPNDIKGLLDSHPNIIRVIANGGKAADAMPKGIEFIQAGSTSGANAVKYEKKLEEWRQLLTI